MQTVCLDSKTVLLYIILSLLIIGWALWRVYTNKEYLSVSTGPNPTTINLNYRNFDNQFRNNYPKFVDLPVPIPVYGYDDGLFHRLGLVYHDTNQEYRLPLYGRRDYPGSKNYVYYVLDHTRYRNKIELDTKDYLSDGDTIKVPGYPGHFTVHLNDNDFPRYHPNVIGGSGHPMPFPSVYA